MFELTVDHRVELRVEAFDPVDGGLYRLHWREVTLADRLGQTHCVQACEVVGPVGQFTLVHGRRRYPRPAPQGASARSR